MTFKLTPDFISNLLKEAAVGNPGPLIEALDPDVRWRIGSEIQDDVAKTGFYPFKNRASWVEQVLGPLQSKLKDGLKLIPLAIDVIDSKAYVEFKGEATQNNGKPYNNNYIWVMIFDEHGHATEIREYLDTGLVAKVFAEN
ncbi:hypothetical protein MMC11_008802 [Xylographa trunciseda]|nr:hypothetical protein [Xylographa trunciseda]